MATENQMRAADRDREETVEILRRAYAEGRLNYMELDERADAVFRARTYGELRYLTADIPPPRSVAPLPSDRPWRPGTRQLRQPAAGRSPRVGLLLLLAVLLAVVIGAATRDTAVIALALLAGCVANIRMRG
jgi:hypothetical protein